MGGAVREALTAGVPPRGKMGRAKGCLVHFETFSRSHPRRHFLLNHAGGGSQGRRPLCFLNFSIHVLVYKLNLVELHWELKDTTHFNLTVSLGFFQLFYLTAHDKIKLG